MFRKSILNDLNDLYEEVQLGVAKTVPTLFIITICPSYSTHVVGGTVFKKHTVCSMNNYFFCTIFMINFLAATFYNPSTYFIAHKYVKLNVHIYNSLPSHVYVYCTISYYTFGG